MVCNIVKCSGSMTGVIEYNEGKVEEGRASCVAVNGMPDSELYTIIDTFSRYESANRRTKNLPFHMSIDPNPDGSDAMDEEQMKSFARALMEKMGYGDQPYVLYRHNDIGREHYHVVSIRVDADGRKISNWKDRTDCLRYMKELQPLYGYAVGDGRKKAESESEGAAENADLTREALFHTPAEPGYVFDPRRGDLARQVYLCFNEALKYNYTTENEFRAVLRAHGIEAMKVGPAGSERFIFQGLDAKGHGCTKLLDQSQGDIDYYSLFKGKAVLNRHYMEATTEERRHVAGIAAACLKHATSEKHFMNMLRRKGMTCTVSRTEEGMMFGAVLVDTKTRCVFKCSQLGSRFSIDDLRAAESAWTAAPSASTVTDSLPAAVRNAAFSGRPAPDRLTEKLTRGSRSLVEAMLKIDSKSRKISKK